MSVQNRCSHGDRNSSSTLGNRMFCFVAVAILISSLVKFLHPPKPVAYLASMGYEGGTVFLIAAGELVIATLCLLPATRRIGLLLISAFLGGAVAAHVATHRSFSGGPFITYMAIHPYVGALIPATLLLIAWIGDYLQRPAERSRGPKDDQHQVRQSHLKGITVGSNSPTSDFS
jgi:hypothetical protein